MPVEIPLLSVQTTKNVSTHCPMLPGGVKSPLTENYCSGSRYLGFIVLLCLKNKKERLYYLIFTFNVANIESHRAANSLSNHIVQSFTLQKSQRSSRERCLAQAYGKNEWPQRNLSIGFLKSHSVLFSLYYTGSHKFDIALPSHGVRNKDRMQHF